MAYKSIICIYYPHQLLPALVALIHHRRYRQEPLEQATLVCVRILTDSQQGKNIAAAIEKIVSTLPWISIKISYTWKLGWLREYDIPVKWRAFLVRQAYKKHPFGEIIYAHDLSADFFTHTFIHAFPDKQRICFGDSLGIVYTQNYFANLRYDNTKPSHQGLSVKFKARLINWLKLKRRQFLLPKKTLDANKAILILPFDPGGDFLTKIPFAIPAKDEVTLVLNWLSRNAGRDKTLEQLIEKDNTKISFFALNNLCESKFATLDNELKLYQHIIDEYAPKKSLLIIKPHPGSSASSLQCFKNRLSHDGEIYYLAEEFSVYPIELNEKLIRRSDLILSMSYTSISIPYLYEKAVIHVLSSQLIDLYFNPEAKVWVEESNEQYLGLMSSLKNWDKKTPLTLS